MKRLAVAGVALALIGVFVALAVSVVDARRPIDAELSRSFGAAVSRAAGRAATISAPSCQKTSVEYYDCGAIVARPRSPVTTKVEYHVWLNDDGCWDTARRTRVLQPPTLGPVRSRFTSLRACFKR